MPTLIKISIIKLIVLLSFAQLTEAQIVNAPIQQEIKEIPLLPELIPVCACESVGSPLKEPSHYDNEGNVLRGRVNPLDIGICQVNLHYHEKQAKELGLDLFIEQDNIIYANVLFTGEGYEPWRASYHCHKNGEF